MVPGSLGKPQGEPLGSALGRGVGWGGVEDGLEAGEWMSWGKAVLSLGASLGRFLSWKAVPSLPREEALSRQMLSAFRLPVPLSSLSFLPSPLSWSGSRRPATVAGTSTPREGPRPGAALRPGAAGVLSVGWARGFAGPMLSRPQTPRVWVSQWLWWDWAPWVGNFPFPRPSEWLPDP